MQTFLLENFTSNNIKIQLDALKKEEVIRELLLVSNGHRTPDDRDELLQALLEREKLMSTGVGNGVAIPHCKSSFSPEFTLALGIHHSGIDFNSI
ncbi:MAG: PTS sugar transporter subunit IIA, partial [Calditrichota bacterium]